jgi:hypothetical protein
MQGINSNGRDGLQKISLFSEFLLLVVEEEASRQVGQEVGDGSLGLAGK